MVQKKKISSEWTVSVCLQLHSIAIVMEKQYVSLPSDPPALLSEFLCICFAKIKRIDKWGQWLCDWVLNFAHGGKFEYILSCKLNFGIFLWTRESAKERFVSLLWYFSAKEMPFVALYRSCLWHFNPEEGFIRQLESTYLCWSKRTWWMNLLLHVLQ